MMLEFPAYHMLVLQGKFRQGVIQKTHTRNNSQNKMTAVMSNHIFSGLAWV